MKLSFGFYHFKGHKEQKIKYLPNVRSLQRHLLTLIGGTKDSRQNIETKINTFPLIQMTSREIEGHKPKHRVEKENITLIIWNFA